MYVDYLFAFIIAITVCVCVCVWGGGGGGVGEGLIYFTRVWGGDLFNRRAYDGINPPWRTRKQSGQAQAQEVGRQAAEE